MPPRKPDYKHFHIGDFSPGIADTPGFTYPSGQATRATFGCRANKSGALVPGPKIVDHVDGTAFEGTTPTGTNGYVVEGIYAFGRIVATPTPGNIYDFELWVATSYGSAAAGGTKKHKLQRIRLFEKPGTPTRDLIEDITITGATDYQNGFGVWFAASRSNKAVPTSPGIPVVVAAWANNDPTTSYVITFPDDASPALDTPYTVVHAGTYMTTHQNRIVMGRITNYAHGVGGILSTTEDLQWTDPNNPSVLSVIQAFYPEVTDGYQIIASMSANELFMLKSSSGLVATGDLDGAFITNLPMTTPTNIGLTPARTPIGLVYGSPYTGVWAWAHGDHAQLLSPQMLPDFWRPATEYVIGNRHTFGCSGNLIFTGNNFYLDLTNGGWWRIADDFPARFWARWDQYMIVASNNYTNGSPLVANIYDVTQQTGTYTWVSQPIRESIDERIDIRECSLRATGTGTVAVTTTDDTGATLTTAYTIATTVPAIQRQNHRFQGTVVKVTIVSTGTGGNPAPTVYDLDLAWDTVQMVPTSGTVA